MKADEFIVGLDIGSSKVAAVIGQQVPSTDADQNQEFKILAISRVAAHGLKKGVIVNIDSTVEAINKAIHEVELMAGVKAARVVVSISGSHISGMNSTGVVGIKGKSIERDDIDRVIDAAKAVPIPGDRTVLHVIPQEFKVDSQDGIQDPFGMMGVRLEAKVHIITAAKSSVQNVIRCCNKRGLQVASVILSPLASAKAVLSQDERELGVALIDIGAGTSDLVIYQNGSISHTAVIPLGGAHIAHDLAIGLRTPQNEAERLKIQKGCTLRNLIDPEETIEVPSVGGRPSRVVNRQLLGEIIEPRAEEILQMINREILSAGCSDTLGGGVVLTGGCTLLSGMIDLAEFIFDLPVKVAAPQGVSGFSDIADSPIYSTAVGLALMGSEDRAAVSRMSLGQSETMKKVRDRITSWIDQVF